jgi:hypothetical protein
MASKISNDNTNSDILVKKLIYLDNTGQRKQRAILKEIDIFKNISIMKIEYLSLKNLNIKNLTFAKYFLNLWYLDVRDNPVRKKIDFMFLFKRLKIMMV